VCVTVSSIIDIVDSMKAIVVGGAGNLGMSFIQALRRANYFPINIDLKLNSEAGCNILVDPAKPAAQQLTDMSKMLVSQLDNGGASCLFCAAGSWRSGSITDDDFLSNIHSMFKVNLETAAIATHLASKFISERGVLMLTGASAALHPLPADIGYGISKSSTHFLVQSAAVDPVFLKKHIHVLGILPQVIESKELLLSTKGEDVDQSSWTKVCSNCKATQANPSLFIHLLTTRAIS